MIFIILFKIEVFQMLILHRNKILPLLQEYFYGDFGKIGMVLGNGFVEKEEDVDFVCVVVSMNHH